MWRKWNYLWNRMGLGAGGEGDDRGWDGWMASPTQWTWVWVNSGSWWWTGRHGVLWFMGSQRVGHDWETELNWWNRNWVTDITDRWLPGGGRWGRDGVGSWVSRCKLLYIEWPNNKVLLYSTGNYIQYPEINHTGKEYLKNVYMCVYIYKYTYI